MSFDLYNNIGVGSISIASVLSHMPYASVSKVALIMPIVSHQELLNYLSRKGNSISSLDKLIIDKTSYFSNFDKRYYDSLAVTINSIQYLNDMKHVELYGENLILLQSIDYDKKMGKRAEKIYKASENIAKLLSEKSEKLYLNLRISL